MKTGSKLLPMLALLTAAGVISTQALALGLGPANPIVTTPRVSVDPRIVDLGVAAPTDVRNISIALAVRNQAGLDAFIASVSNPASANFRQFITPQQFAASYGQTPAAVAQVLAYLQAQGFTALKVNASNLLISASGTNAQIAAAFGTSVHKYSLLGSTYVGPATKPIVPAALASLVSSVSGISTRSFLRKHTAVVPNTGALAGDVAPPRAVGGVPGAYTVNDVAAKYNINPLYAKGLSGAGRTIGIATLAGYYQADAYAYWAGVGLTVDPYRITDVLVDGGASSDSGPGTDGAGETTLDVEQSGGLAPGAQLRVYIAPNTDLGFIHLFDKAVNENLVDVLSVSWGSPEIAYDPSEFPIYHAIFAQAAAQGIPVIAAAGDAGAFDINRGYPYPTCSTQLTVDFPAAEPLVLAAGGTTLPNSVKHKFGTVTVATERAWGWDYLKNYIVGNYGTDLYYASYYTVGGGGGVSVNYPLPAFQGGLTGVQTSAANQTLMCGPPVTKSGYADEADLPTGFAGRNLPDVSLNADPYSGYAVYEKGAWDAQGSGGTSFVAPQLNGILTLISSGITPTAGNPKGRVGAINPQLYAAFKTQGYGAGSPFRAITAGDNEYYQSTSTYNPSTGLGSLDVSNLAKALGVQ